MVAESRCGLLLQQCLNGTQLLVPPYPGRPLRVSPHYHLTAPSDRPKIPATAPAPLGPRCHHHHRPFLATHHGHRRGEVALIILIEEETFQQGPATCEEGTALSLTKVLEPVLGLNTVQNNTSSTNRSNKTPTRGRDHSEDKGPEAGVAPACLRDSVEACVADVKRLREEQYEARSEVTWQVRLVGH